MLGRLLLSLLRALFGVGRQPTQPPGPPPQPPAPETGPGEPVTTEPPGQPPPGSRTPGPTPTGETTVPGPTTTPAPEVTEPVLPVDREVTGPAPSVSPGPPAPKTIVPVLIYPRLSGNEAFNQMTQVGNDRYYTSTPWEVDEAKVNEAIRSAEDWLAQALGRKIEWNRLRVVNSDKTVPEWRATNIHLIKGEVERLGLDWTDDYIYLAFVRGMGGYAGGIGYRGGDAGFAMVGDICLEAICEYSSPTAGSMVLGGQGWQANSFSKVGQTGAFIHEALHGLDLPHPNGWPENDRPDWDETLMGNWWNMPNFINTTGLTQREIDKVLRWTA